MANTRDIRRRIKSVKNTGQITKAMQLVAASKMKRAQNSALAGRPYAQLMAEIISSLDGKLDDITHPFLIERKVENRGVLLISTDKGLCGGLNGNLFRKITEIKTPTKFVTIGRKGTQFLTRTDREVLAEFSMSDKVRFSEARLPIEYLIKAYLEGQIDTIEIIYSHFENTLKQEPLIRPMLPLKNLKEAFDEYVKENDLKSVTHDTREIQFEPAASNFIDTLLDLFLKNEIYHTILEAKASEHSARMVAMKTATDNAKSLVDDLSLQYNKARQAAITQEILEIAAGQSS